MAASAHPRGLLHQFALHVIKSCEQRGPESQARGFRGNCHEDDVPEVVTRKRLGRRTGGVRFKLHRWFYRNRPQVAVFVAFVIFVLAGILFAGFSIKSTGHRPADVEASTPPT